MLGPLAAKVPTVGSLRTLLNPLPYKAFNAAQLFRQHPELLPAVEEGMGKGALRHCRRGH